MNKIISLIAVTILITSCKKNSVSSVITKNTAEVETAVYNTDASAIKIGTQIWLVKNLDRNFYNNGDLIPHVKDPVIWKDLTTGAWCWYNNDSVNYATTYGKLYNWYAVNDPRGLAPPGWHIPDEAEWSILEMRLGNKFKAGGRMKERGFSHWSTPNTGAINSSGFSALPGGYRLYNGEFYNLTLYGFFWSASEYNSEAAWYRQLNYNSATIFTTANGKVNGFSVRCLKDQ